MVKLKRWGVGSILNFGSSPRRKGTNGYLTEAADNDRPYQVATSRWATAKLNNGGLQAMPAMKLRTGSLGGAYQTLTISASTQLVLTDRDALATQYPLEPVASRRSLTSLSTAFRCPAFGQCQVEVGACSSQSASAPMGIDHIQVDMNYIHVLRLPQCFCSQSDR